MKTENSAILLFRFGYHFSYLASGRSNSLGMRFRIYKLRMTQTITQISTMVPISPYPNIVASTENTILGFSLPDIDLEGQRRVSVRHCIP